MAEINAKSEGKGIIDKTLDTIKSIFDKFFDMMSKLDDNSKLNLSNGKFEKTGPQSGTYTGKYASKVPVAVDIELHDDGKYADYKFYINDTEGMKHPVEYKNQPFMYCDDPKFIKLYTDAMEQVITKDVKQAFGIKFSKTLNVRLHKITGSKEDSIMLTGIKANFNDPYTANLMLDSILSDDSFVEQLTEEPIDFEIIDTDDDYEISSIDQEQIDYMNEGFKTILCAAIKFNMAMQILHWQSYSDEKLFTITNDMLWTSQDCVNTFGMWGIEFNIDVTTAMISESCLSSFTTIDSYTGSIGAEIKEAIAEFVDMLNWEYPNFPHDIQNELDCRIRRMNETLDLGLRDY